MTRFVGPDPDSRSPFGDDRNLAGRAADLYTDAACTSLADVRVFDPASPSTVGAAITNSRVTLDAQGRLPKVWYPNNVNTLYARLVRGDRRAIAVTATKPGPVQVYRSSSGDTSDLVAVFDEAANLMFRVDSRGRIRTQGLASGQTPTVAAGAALGSAGNGAAAALTNASDMAGTLSVTTASTGTAAGTLATITLTAAFGANAKVVFFPKDAASAALQPYATTNTSTAALKTAATPTAATTYTFDYIIVG